MHYGTGTSDLALGQNERSTLEWTSAFLVLTQAVKISLGTRLTLTAHKAFNNIFTVQREFRDVFERQLLPFASLTAFIYI